MLRTQIVLGINDKDLQSKLLREDLPLSKIVNYCQAVEQAEMHRSVVKKENPSLDQIRRDQQIKSKGPNQAKKNNSRYKRQEYISKNQVNFNDDIGKGSDRNVKMFNCNKCAKSHGINECPEMLRKNCKHCGKPNHFAVKCRSKVNKGQLNEVQINNSNGEEKEVTYLSFNSMESEKHSSWTDTVVIDNKNELEIKLDIGAQLNVMSLKEFKKLNKNLESSSVVIKSFGDFKIKSLGKVKVKLKN